VLCVVLFFTAATVVIARALRDFIAVNASCAAHQVPQGYADASVCTQLGPRPGASIMANRRLLLRLIRAQRYTGASGQIVFDANGDPAAAEYTILNQRKPSPDGKQTPAIIGSVGALCDTACGQIASPASLSVNWQALWPWIVRSTLSPPLWFGTTARASRSRSIVSRQPSRLI
jgi:hypothetical protein